MARKRIGRVGQVRVASAGPFYLLRHIQSPGSNPKWIVRKQGGGLYYVSNTKRAALQRMTELERDYARQNPDYFSQKRMEEEIARAKQARMQGTNTPFGKKRRG